MNKYWFRKRQGIKSKDLGYGFVPISWEGWILTLSFIGVLLYLPYNMGLYNSDAADPGVQFVIILISLIVLFFFIAKSRSID